MTQLLKPAADQLPQEFFIGAGIYTSNIFVSGENGRDLFNRKMSDETYAQIGRIAYCRLSGNETFQLNDESAIEINRSWKQVDTLDDQKNLIKAVADAFEVPSDDGIISLAAMMINQGVRLQTGSLPEERKISLKESINRYGFTVDDENDCDVVRNEMEIIFQRFGKPNSSLTNEQRIIRIELMKCGLQKAGHPQTFPDFSRYSPQRLSNYERTTRTYLEFRYPLKN